MAKRVNPQRNGSLSGAKPLRDALMLELHSEMEVPKDLHDSMTDTKRGKNGSRKATGARIIAHRLVTKALKGDTDAIKEINNRVEGKAVQPLANDPENPLLPTNEGVFEVAFVKSKTKK